MDSPRAFAGPSTPERWVRPRPFRVNRVDLDLRIDLTASSVEGSATHAVQRLPHGAPFDSLHLDRHDAVEVLGVQVDGRDAAFSLAAGRIDIAVSAGEHLSVRVAFRTRAPAKGLAFVPAAPGQPAMAWTQGAMEDHSWWFPCFDSPNNRCSWSVRVRHDAALLALSNGERLGREDHGDGSATTTWEQRLPSVLYLLNLAVGDFVEVSDERGPVPISHFLPRGTEACGRDLFRATGFALDWFGAYLDLPYPWPRYGHVLVRRFPWGGMENVTLTTITDRVLMDAAVQAREEVDADELVIHEAAHQWFGDLFTMKGWADIWLNESFATWLEARCTAAWRAQGDAARERDEFDRKMWADREAYLDEDGSRYRRALVTRRYDDAYELFDRVAYEKGALVLQHLSCVLGEERFRAAIRLYAQRHSHDLVDTSDLRQAIEDATGEPVDWFFAQWVERAGHPELKIAWRHDPARGKLLVEITQEQATADASLVFRLPCALVWESASGVERRMIDVQRAQETLVFDCAAAPRWLVVDPDGHVPAAWDEKDGVEALVARLEDARLGASARARAAAAAGGRHATPTLVEALRRAAADARSPELLRAQAIAALGKLAIPAARASLLGLLPDLAGPRLRRNVAGALAARVPDAAEAARLAQRLEALADAEASELVAGELLAARGAIQHPGATAALRGRLRRDSWQQRLRTACVRGLGASGEAAAIDEVLGLLADPGEHQAVRCAACAAAARLGARHRIARDRVRRALEDRLDEDLHLRSAAARALGDLGDAAARAALGTRRDREVFGNVVRVLREAGATLDRVAASDEAGDLKRRVDELDKQNKALERRLDAIDKRLG